MPENNQPESAPLSGEGPCDLCLGSKEIAASSETVMACPKCQKCGYGCTREMYCVSCKIHRPRKLESVSGEGGERPESKYSRADLEKYYRWQAESLKSFRDKFGAESNCQALDAIDELKRAVTAQGREDAPGDAMCEFVEQAQYICKSPTGPNRNDIDSYKDILATTFTCKGRNNGPGGMTPGDCDWPLCGCDPRANKVIEAIEESGLNIVKLGVALSATEDAEKHDYCRHGKCLLCEECEQCKDKLTAIQETKARVSGSPARSVEARLREALQRLYYETAEYIHINNLGDVHHNQAMQMARDALALPGSLPTKDPVCDQYGFGTTPERGSLPSLAPQPDSEQIICVECGCEKPRCPCGHKCQTWTVTRSKSGPSLPSEGTRTETRWVSSCPACKVDCAGPTELAAKFTASKHCGSSIPPVAAPSDPVRERTADVETLAREAAIVVLKNYFKVGCKCDDSLNICTLCTEASTVLQHLGKLEGAPIPKHPSAHLAAILSRRSAEPPIYSDEWWPPIWDILATARKGNEMTDENAIGVRELLYDSAAFPDVLKRFPSATMEDASDFVHESCIEISIPDATLRQFFKAAVLDGYYPACLTLNIAMYEPESRKWMREALNEIKDGAGQSKETER